MKLREQRLYSLESKYRITLLCHHFSKYRTNFSLPRLHFEEYRLHNLLPRPQSTPQIIYLGLQPSLVKVECAGG